MRKILFLKLFFYCFVAFSQVGIGTDFPNTSAQLDIVSIDKGVLLPRIALIGTDDVTTISNGNKGGLLIYNTATTEGANEVTPGFYYWSESKNIWIGLTVNATTSRSGGIQLAGDLTGSASAPIVADGAITNIKLASTTGTESVVLSDSAILTGNPQAPTPATTDNSTALATTAFVKAVATSGNVADEINDGTTTVAPSQNAVFDALGLKVDKAAGERLITALEITTLENQMGTNTGDQDLSGFVTSTALDLKANLISPTFTGTPQAPTPLFADNSKTIATTAFVKAVATTSVTDAISDGETTMAPSQNAVFDALDSKENTITATSNTDYYRGDKTFQTLNKAAVGLPNVDNTSDSDKPVSAATTTAMGLKEDAITATTTTDYYRGDKTFQTLNKTVVGLPNVDNTSDADKPVSTATASALGLKEDAISATTTADYYRGDKTFQTLNKAAVGLPNIDNTSDLDKPVSTATASALGLKEDAISATTTTDYYRGDKTFQTLNKAAVGLPNVDNTSDADKPVSTATQTALDLKVDKALLDGKIVIGNASNLGAAVTPNGDVTIDNLGETTIGASKVTYAKIQNVSATNRVLGRTSAGSGIVEEISTTGTGNVVMSNSPTLFTPNLGIPTTLVGTNITGTASGLTAGIANTVSSEDESADTTSFPLFVNSSGTQISQPKSNTFFKFNALTGQLATNSFSSSGLMSADGFLGTGGTTYTQNNNAKINGNVSLNSGTIDSPGIHFYSGNNSNWGIDNSSGALRFVKNLDEAAGIPYASFTANGSFLLQASSVFDIHGAALVVKAAYPKTPVEIQQDGALAHNAITFYNGNGLVGAIYTSGTTTAYATSSDENLKKNIVKAPEATEIARKMRTISYNFKLDNQFIEFGFGARELYKIYPDAVTAPEEGSWGLDYGRLTPILLKYTQEVDKRVSALETKESTALILEMVKNLQEKVNALQKELDLLKNKN